MTQPRLTISCCWSFGDLVPEDGLPRLRDLGCEAVEIWSQDLRRWGIPRWASALRASGLACSQVCPYLDVIHGGATIEMGHYVIMAMREACAAFACHRIRVFTGPPWGRWSVGPQAADETMWGEAATGLALYADAVGEGIELCLECHAGSLMEDTASTTRLLAAVARPNLTVNLQLPFAGEVPAESALTLAPWTTHIHMHGYAAGWSGHLVCLAEETTPWEPVLRTLLRAGGRDLTLSLEHIDHNERKSDPWETVARDLPWLHALRRRLHDGSPYTAYVVR